jgi:hypothetical protein
MAEDEAKLVQKLKLLEQAKKGFEDSDEDKPTDFELIHLKQRSMEYDLEDYSEAQAVR